MRTLVLLLEECGVETTALWDFTELTPFAVQFRYESLGGMDVGLDSVDWLKRVRDLVNQVEALRVELNNGCIDGMGYFFGFSRQSRVS
ncbi:MAG: hypothetical protein HQL75_15740 [Magnetococcales bacterium]|nr:hypothetical protein [Magnetococcales bacterium]